MHNICTHCVVFLVMHDREEESKKKARKKMTKIEIFIFGFLKLDKGYRN